MIKMRLILFMALMVVLVAGTMVYAGKVYTLNSAVTTTAQTGSAQSVDGHYKDWVFQTTCTGNMTADSAAPATVTVEGTVDGTSYETIATQTWTTSTAGTKHFMFRLTNYPTPVKKIRGKWTTIPWTTVGSCSLTGLGVN